MRIQNEAGFYLAVELQGRVDILPDHPGYEHFHPFWEFIWAEESVSVHCGEKTVITHTAILPAGVPHRVSGAGRQCRMLYLGFRFAGGSDPPQQALIPPPNSMFDTACRSLAALPAEEFFAAQSSVLALLAEVLRGLPSAAESQGHRCALTEKVKRLCALPHNYSVKQMAGMLYVSPNYLSSVFHAETGMRIKEYQTHVRMEEALRLLVATELPVVAIAAKLGYANPSYFIRCFEQHYQRTPGSVRQTGAPDEKEL